MLLSSWVVSMGWICISWWHHQMETFSALLAFCVGNSLVTGEFCAQRPVTRSFDFFFDLRLNQQVSKQWRCSWFEMPLCSLWRHCNIAYYQSRDHSVLPPLPMMAQRRTPKKWHGFGLQVDLDHWRDYPLEQEITWTNPDDSCKLNPW